MYPFGNHTPPLQKLSSVSRIKNINQVSYLPVLVVVAGWLPRVGICTLAMCKEERQVYYEAANRMQETRTGVWVARSFVVCVPTNSPVLALPLLLPLLLLLSLMHPGSKRYREERPTDTACCVRTALLFLLMLLLSLNEWDGGWQKRSGNIKDELGCNFKRLGCCDGICTMGISY